MEPIFGKYAERYVTQGFAVFPLAPGSKKPFKESTGLSEATSDLAKVRYCAALTPCANIGLRTGQVSGISVADLDPLKYGFETERYLAKEGKRFPATAVQQTRTGGRHMVMRYHPALITGTNRLGQGIDFRNDGGYIVAAHRARPGCASLRSCRRS
jgi:hypothetical protein